MAVEKKKPKTGKLLRKLLLKTVHRLDQQHELLQQITTLLATNNAGIQTEKDLSAQMLKVLESIEGEAKKLKKHQAKTNELLEQMGKKFDKTAPAAPATEERTLEDAL